MKNLKKNPNTVDQIINKFYDMSGRYIQPIIKTR